MSKYLTIEKLVSYNTPVQRSKEWFDLRSRYLTSSDLGTVLGKNKYKSAEELYNEKIGVSKKEYIENEAIRHGIKYKSEAIELYCNVLERTNHEIGLVPFTEFQDPDTFCDVSMDCSFLAGSVDSVTVANTNPDSLNIIEVKCPLFRRIKYGVIPDYYYPQIQMNIHILNVQFGDYVEYVPINTQNNSRPLLNIVRVYRDENWLRGVYPELRQFWDSVTEGRASLL